jgi:hypothetical protein
LAEQSFIVGDVMKSIDEMYPARENLDNEDDDDNTKNKNETKNKRPIVQMDLSIQNDLHRIGL